MQAYAQAADEALLARDGACLAGGHESLARELAPGAAEARGASDPQHRRKIAQAAGALLDVGLEVVDRVLILQMALLLLERLGVVERADVHAFGEPAPELAVQRARPREQPVLEQARTHRHVGGHLDLALLDGAHGVRQLDADVPQHGEELLDGLGRRRGARRQEDQHVDVGVRIELAATVAADRDRGQSIGHPGVAEHVADDAIDEACMVAQEASRVGRGEERVAQLLALGAKLAAPLRHTDRRSPRWRRGRAASTEDLRRRHR